MHIQLRITEIKCQTLYFRKKMVFHGKHLMRQLDFMFNKLVYTRVEPFRTNHVNNMIQNVSAALGTRLLLLNR